MEITLLIESFLGLVAVLAVLIFFLFYVPRKRKEKAKREEVSKPPVKRVIEYPSFKELVKIVKNRESSTDDLIEALNLIIEHYGVIPPKLGIRTHPEFTTYAEIIVRICRHPNTNKNIIVKFDRDLEQKNPAYKKEINDFLTKGLNSRGA
jgi:chromatin segregation and condensation protein Rec8/ScpA/Scc1 (kleisin family)